MTERKYGVAVIGYGGMGSWHVKELLEMKEAELCGVYDIDPDKIEKAQSLGIHTYTSLEELLADDRVWIVTIATPNDTHCSIAIQAMQMKKNVVCEKPAAMNTRELSEMIQASEDNHVIFTAHHNRRWDQDYLAVKQMYDQNTLGRIFNIESRIQGSRGIFGDWRKTREHGGGMVMDWGVHLFDQLLTLTKEKIVSVYAQLSYVTGHEVDDGFKAVIQFADGFVCQAEVNTYTFINLPRWYLQGEKGTAIINDWELEGKIVQILDDSDDNVEPVAAASGISRTVAPRDERTVKESKIPHISSNVQEFYQNIFGTLDGEDSLIVKPDEIMRCMKLMEVVIYAGEVNEVTHCTI